MAGLGKPMQEVLALTAMIAVPASLAVAGLGLWVSSEQSRRVARIALWTAFPFVLLSLVAAL